MVLGSVVDYSTFSDVTILADVGVVTPIQDDAASETDPCPSMMEQSTNVSVLGHVESNVAGHSYVL